MVVWEWWVSPPTPPNDQQRRLDMFVDRSGRVFKWTVIVVRNYSNNGRRSCVGREPPGVKARSERNAQALLEAGPRRASCGILPRRRPGQSVCPESIVNDFVRWATAGFHFRDGCARARRAALLLFPQTASDRAGLGCWRDADGAEPSSSMASTRTRFLRSSSSA